MAINRDGLEIGEPVDFETLQRIKRVQQEAAKHGKPKREKRAGSSSKSPVRKTAEPTVQGVDGSKES